MQVPRGIRFESSHVLTAICHVCTANACLDFVTVSGMRRADYKLSAQMEGTRGRQQNIWARYLNRLAA